MNINPLVHVRCCGGGCGVKHVNYSEFSLTEVKGKVDFHLDDIPFRSDNKLVFVICSVCKLPTEAIFSNPAFTKATLTAAAYLKAQDELYKYTEGSDFPMVYIEGNVSVTEIIKRTLQSNKQWNSGAITYDFYDEHGHGFGREPFTVYCTDEAVVQTAIAQFVRPDIFKGITNVRSHGRA